MYVKAGVVGLCLLIRLAVMIAVAPWSADATQILIGKGDPSIYNGFALRMLKGEGYAHPEGTLPSNLQTLPWAYPGEAEVLWPPGYPFFIATIYRLFGLNLTALLLAQIVAATLGCLLLMRATELLYGWRAGLVAGVIYSLEPVYIQLSNTVWSEALHTPMLTLPLYFFALALTTEQPGRRVAWLAAAGFSLGLSAYVRVTTLPVALVAWVVLVILWARAEGLRRAALYASSAFTAFWIAVLPWYWRNYQEFGHFAFSTSSAYNLLVGVGFRGDTEALFAKAYHLAAQSSVKRPEHLNPFERARFWRQVALNEWAADPLGNAQIYLKRLFVVLTAPGVSGWQELFRLPVKRTEPHDKTVSEIIKEFIAKLENLAGAIGAYSVSYTAVFYIFCVIALFRRSVVAHNKATQMYLTVALLVAIFSVVTLVNNSHPRGRLIAWLVMTPLTAAYISQRMGRL